ncbi:hypothetical protein RHMOL_Rhmol11G0232400 [Rhododendron molle]|uniref:Uncharacterized protein n=1 Tax=Rhododendron molle TaxID=49168 RepID=A0ACC0LVZ8_RHOML|nr:hypothetical protein RHMOL_Rhmol11G0232400 [Rhododendron molle]
MESEDGLGTEAPQTLSTDWSVTWISSDISISLWVHVVTDGSWNSDTRKAGAGWIIRTAEGQTLSKGGRGFSAVSALHAEMCNVIIKKVDRSGVQEAHTLASSSNIIKYKSTTLCDYCCSTDNVGDFYFDPVAADDLQIALVQFSLQ